MLIKLLFLSLIFFDLKISNLILSRNLDLSNYYFYKTNNDQQIKGFRK
uniref:Uncharacterized protein n=1 Tax=Meloidogyne enterolobii TaxID=390850 RepID=A0A6V7U1C2_MELEN|nr:unnamed protein product [Meloidogyne enterolobii]